MVLGLRSKNRKGNSIRVDYIVYVKEINPWTPLRSAQSILLQWENGDQSSGSLGSSIGNGKLEFSESFRLPVTLCQEASRKSTGRASFQKNFLEFYLYEPRKDMVAKGQLLGSAVVNLADYGIIKETITISTPVNLKRSSRNREKPVLYLNIQPFDKDSSSSSIKGSLSNEVSLDKDGSESVSELINEGNDKELEIASFTDDDYDDDDFSSHSSQTITSSVFDPSRESHSQHDKNGSESANGGIGRLELTLPSGGTRANPGVSAVVEAFKQVNGNTSSSSSIDLSSNLENPVNDLVGKVASSEACVTIPVGMNLDHVKDQDSHTNREGDGKVWRHDQSNVAGSLSSISHVGHWKGNREKTTVGNELDGQILDTEKHSLQDRLGFRLPQDSTREQIKFSNTFASSRTATKVLGGFIANDGEKHVTPAQLHFDMSKTDEPSKKIQFEEMVKENDIPEKIPNDTISDTLSEREEAVNCFSNSKDESGESYGLINKTQLMEKAKENGTPEKIHFGSTTETHDEIKENANSDSDGNIDLESKIDIPEKIPSYTYTTGDTLSERDETTNSFSNSKAESGESYGLQNKSQFMEKAKENDIPEKIHIGSKTDTHNESEENANRDSYGNIELESKIDIPGKIPNDTASDTLGENEETANSFSNSQVESGKSYGLPDKTQLMEKAKENDIPEKIHNGSTTDKSNESEGNVNSFYNGNIELEFKIEMLEEELREAAVLEASLYSVVAEHGSSTNKVHAPARRLSRFYLHACKASSQEKKASAARAVVSGLVLVSKACGNDVPRLTFWLSNSIVLRAIVSQATGEMQLFSGVSLNCSSRGKVSEDTSPLDKEERNSMDGFDDWVDPQTFLLALEKFEAWIFSRIIESVWWQTLTPRMQSAAARSSSSRKTSTRRYGLGDQEQGNFSVELWKKAFKDACERLCPIRACGHECGCLVVLAKLVIEQLVGRLDVAMFNAILRESAEEMPTDPVSDPISDSKVLPIPSGKSGFGAGVQLKNAVGNWSRWLTDLFGIDDIDGPEDSNEAGDDKNAGCEASFKAFGLLNALSDLMMLPSEMLVDRSTRKEVCPKFSVALISRVLNNFVPDEFNPNPVSDAVFEALDEDLSEAGEDSITNYPCMATPIVYSPPSAASLTSIIVDIGSQAMQRSRSSVLRKSYTSCCIMLLSFFCWS
ncbi:hypothetical protein PTKIN_Ptkin17bG0100400 [Pterospermum kingtungense]